MAEVQALSEPEPAAEPTVVETTVSPYENARGSVNHQSMAHSKSESVLSGTRLLEYQRAAKAAEEDAQRLKNRVKQLEMEERKAEKRIEETRKRASEIVMLKERNAQREAEKKQYQLMIQKERLHQSELQRQQREESAARKANAYGSLHDKKKSSGDEVKTERMENEKRLAELRLAERKRALESKMNIRREQEKAKESLEKSRAEFHEHSKSEYQARLDTELHKRTQKEKELAQMAKLELELIERLQKKQNEQRKAYSELENALGVKEKPKKKIAATASGGGGGGAPVTEEPGEREVEQQFSLLDEAGTGAISVDKLGQLMANLGVALDPAQLDKATKQLDRAGNGTVTYGEFLLWWKG